MTMNANHKGELTKAAAPINDPNYNSHEAQMWRELASIYSALGKRGGSIDPDHALLLVEIQKRLPVAHHLEP